LLIVARLGVQRRADAGLRFLQQSQDLGIGVLADAKAVPELGEAFWTIGDRPRFLKTLVCPLLTADGYFPADCAQLSP